MKERSYLIEILPEDSQNNRYLENTLTKVFCATFNNSVEFKKIICKLVGIRKKAFDNIHARNQKLLKNENEAVILDIFIYEDDEKIPLCIIENKTEDELTEEQLKKQAKIFNKNYQKYKNIPKVAIVKYFCGDTPEPWKILRWQSDIYGSLSDEGMSDDILVQEFKNFLEVMKMAVPADLTRQEIKNMGEFLYAMKETKTSITLKDRSIFTSFKNYYDILSYCIDRLKENKSFKEKIEKNFRFNPIINSWWECDNKKVDLFIGNYIFFNKELSLEKPEEKIDGIHIGVYYKKGKEPKDEKSFTFKVIFVKREGNSCSYIKENTISDNDLFRKAKDKNGIIDCASLSNAIQKIIDENI